MHSYTNKNIAEVMPQSFDSNVNFLRAIHPVFIYDSYDFNINKSGIEINFKFILEPDIVFTPKIIIKSNDLFVSDEMDYKQIEYIAFHIGLIEILSYWKVACSPEIIIKPNMINEIQVNWWKDLLINGMSEFFFVNKINYMSSDFLKVSVPNQLLNHTTVNQPTQLNSNRNLVLVSGGKDSAFSVQFFKENNIEFNCLLVNPTEAANEIIRQIKCHSPIVVQRTLDPKLFELNKLGYLNGHTPFSALVAIIGVMTAALFGYDNVVTSNERSCDEYNTKYLGKVVNHQYSKTFQFENSFNIYVKSYLSNNINYFSLLRPLYEVQIAYLFSNYPEFLSLFKSCNKNQKENTWCLRCAKCLSTFIYLYPFLPINTMIGIFGDNIFDKEDNIPLLRTLVGLDGYKPFECVGTKVEILAALYLAMESEKERGQELSLLLSYAEQNIFPYLINDRHNSMKILSSWNGQNNLPLQYAELLKNYVNTINE